jgi:type IV pilus assembly protein PilV
MRVNPSALRRSSQQGVLLLEVLIAVLVFSVGVLGLVGLQANATKQSSQARYRTEAMLLANDLFGQMWVAQALTASDLAAAFVSGSAPYDAWLARVSATLPGASANPPTVNVVTVEPLFSIVAGASAPADGALSATARVTVTLRWKPPSDGAGDPLRQYVATTELRL